VVICSGVVLQASAPRTKWLRSPKIASITIHGGFAGVSELLISDFSTESDCKPLRVRPGILSTPVSVLMNAQGSG